MFKRKSKTDELITQLSSILKDLSSDIKQFAEELHVLYNGFDILTEKQIQLIQNVAELKTSLDTFFKDAKRPTLEDDYSV